MRQTTPGEGEYLVDCNGCKESNECPRDDGTSTDRASAAKIRSNVPTACMRESVGLGHAATIETVWSSFYPDAKPRLLRSLGCEFRFELVQLADHRGRMRCQTNRFSLRYYRIFVIAHREIASCAGIEQRRIVWQ
ncbi:hypothetical protein Rcae01_02274 [Novipirellula caenicola]|uniref:Uncharacterized protein n=1 Tax=Novipirellula caenicola TaxID=1536901 RepID=A0ABP9VNS2_9BACT